MMKKLMVLGLISVMVMACAMSASAYIIRVQGSTPGTLGASSATGQISNESDAFTPLGAAVSQEASYAVYQGNVVGGPLGHTLKMINAPAAWYGTVTGRGGYAGNIEVRFFSTTTASKLAAGKWYLYKGIAQVTGNQVTNASEVTLLSSIDGQAFSTAQSTWATSTFGGVFAEGEKWTLTQATTVPEPGSIVAMLSGLVGLVGYGIRRRK